MGRKAGFQKSPESGRKKGTPNKRTLEFQEKLESLGIHPLEGLKELIPKLSVELRVKVYLDLLPYIYPKRKSFELSEEDEEILTRAKMIHSIPKERLDEMLKKAIEEKKNEIEL